jgi:molybdopterin converting factor small subunit
MAIRVHLTPTLRRFCDNLECVEVVAGTVGDAIEALHARYNGIRERVLDEAGNVRGSVLIFVNHEDIRFLEFNRTPLKSGDELSIIPAYAGG